MKLKDMGLFELPDFGGLGEIVPGLICLAFIVVPVITVIVIIIATTSNH